MFVNLDLLKKVIAKPDEDSPRIDYANWCKKEGNESLQSYGEYILLSLELANLKKNDQISKKTRLLSKVSRMEHEYSKTWASWYKLDFNSCAFHRGFVEKIGLSATDFIKGSIYLFDQAPIRHLDLRETRTMTGEVFKINQLSKLRSLNLQNNELTDGDIPALTSSIYLNNLRWLSLANNDIGMEGVSKLAESKNFPQLKYLNFFGNKVQINEVYSYDNGQVMDSHLSLSGIELESKFGHIRWLHHNAKSIVDTIPDRFKM